MFLTVTPSIRTAYVRGNVRGDGRALPARGVASLAAGGALAALEGGTGAEDGGTGAGDGGTGAGDGGIGAGDGGTGAGDGGTGVGDGGTGAGDGGTGATGVASAAGEARHTRTCPLPYFCSITLLSLQSPSPSTSLPSRPQCPCLFPHRLPRRPLLCYPLPTPPLT
ncbi:unnamed protein product [Closterium sp. NIES-65]|nr:unnamed protein product [Closterium sp. NIES-65]